MYWGVPLVHEPKPRDSGRAMQGFRARVSPMAILEHRSRCSRPFYPSRFRPSAEIFSVPSRFSGVQALAAQGMRVNLRVVILLIKRTVENN